MSRPLIRSAISVSLAALALGACVADSADSGLYILRNNAPDSGCVVDPTSDVFRASGRIDSGATRGYFFTPVARNDLTVREGESGSQKTVFVEGGRITIDFLDGDFLTEAERTQFATEGLTRFATRTSGSVEPSGSVTTFGFEVVPVDLLREIGNRLPEPSADNLAPSTLLDVGVQLYGTVGGGEIESNVFHYPVEVCKNCVVDNVGPCDLLPDNFEADQGGACNVLQDGELDCCTLADGSFLCPAQAPTTKS